MPLPEALIARLHYAVAACRSLGPTSPIVAASLALTEAAIWKAAHVVPVLKLGKATDQAASYRPVSLLCLEIKVLERLLLPTLKASLSLAPSKHGFWKNRSTVTGFSARCHCSGSGL